MTAKTKSLITGLILFSALLGAYLYFRPELAERLRAFAVLPAADDRLRMGLEILLLFLIAVIFASVSFLFYRKGTEPAGSEDIADGSIKKMTSIKAAEPDTLPRGNDDSDIESFIIQELNALYSKFKPSASVLYLSAGDSIYVKAVSVSKSDIDSPVKEALTFDSEIINEMLEAKYLLSGAGHTIHVPFFSQGAALGIVTLINPEGIASGGLKSISGLCSAAGLKIADFLESNGHVVVGGDIDSPFALRLKLKKSEFLKKTTGRPFSVMLIETESAGADTISAESIYRALPEILYSMGIRASVSLNERSAVILLPYSASEAEKTAHPVIEKLYKTHEFPEDESISFIFGISSPYSLSSSEAYSSALEDLASGKNCCSPAPKVEEAKMTSKENISNDNTVAEPVLNPKTKVNETPGDEPAEQTEPAKDIEGPTVKPKKEKSKPAGDSHLNNPEVLSSNGRRIRATIGAKMITIISLVIISSLSLMTFLATHFFMQDNEIRIKESNHQISEIIAEKVKTDFDSIIEKSRYIARGILDEKPVSLEDSELSERLFPSEKNIILVATAVKTGKGIKIQNGLLNTNLASSMGISAKAVSEYFESSSEVFLPVFKTQDTVTNISPAFKQEVIAVSVPYLRKSAAEAESILIVFVNNARFTEAVSKPGITRSFIASVSGDIIAHYNSSLTLAGVNYSNFPMVKIMAESPVDNSQTSYSDEKGVTYLGSFKKIGFAGIGVITTVVRDDVFSAAYRIRKQNIFLTVIVLNLAILIIYFFSKTITGPIKRLVSATREIEKGNYSVSIYSKSRDEVGMLTDSFTRMSKGLSEREKIKDAFGKFVNPEIAEKVLRDEIKLGGERKDVAVFFSDIRSFTAMSEKLEPEEVVEFLNQYMTRMVECINTTSGVVDKFIGDAIMATWGAPVSHGNDTENAVNASLMMRKTLLDFNRDRGDEKKPLIRIGCGINTGPVLAGQIGSHDKMEYTVIGDAVNLASRIESLNKPFGTDILISEASYGLVRDIFRVEAMQEIKVKGKEATQKIFAVLGRMDDPECPEDIGALRELIGLGDFIKQDIDVNAEEIKYEIVSGDAQS